jgi:hypothetical protein
VVWVFLGEIPTLMCNDNDPYEWCDPLEGVVVATLSTLGTRVKTVDPCGLGGDCWIFALEVIIIKLLSSPMFITNFMSWYNCIKRKH